MVPTVCAAHCLWRPRRREGRWRGWWQRPLSTFVDRGPADVACTAVIPAELPAVVNAYHLGIEEAIC